MGRLSYSLGIEIVSKGSDILLSQQKYILEVDFHFVREKVAQRQLSVQFITTDDQFADVFTKPLSSQRFLLLRSKLRVATQYNTQYNNNYPLPCLTDVMTGTSSGALTIGMLSVPNKDNRPIFTASDIVELYHEHSHKIFPHSSNPLVALLAGMANLWRPKYDSAYLNKLIEDSFGSTKLHETLTKVIIPAYIFKSGENIIFSSYQMERDPSLDALLSDIIIATMAAPTYFRLHSFHTTDTVGNWLKEFNLIDGALVENSPAFIAITEVLTELKERDKPNLLVLSLGTGLSKIEERYDAQKSWGMLSWFWALKALIKMNNKSRQELVEAYIRSLHLGDNYLRIQEYNLNSDMASLDLSTPENLRNLEKVGEQLVKRNEAALTRFANKLSDNMH